MSDRSRRATTAAKSAASAAFQRAEEAKKGVRAQQRTDYNAVMDELGGPSRSIAETMAPYMAGPTQPGTERARYEAIMGKPYPGTETGMQEDETMGRGRRRRKTKKAGRRRKTRKTRRRS